MLLDIKAKVERAKSLLAQPDKTLEINEESRRLNNDFKHYIRRQLALTQGKNEEAELLADIYTNPLAGKREQFTRELEKGLHYERANYIRQRTRQS